MRLRGDREIATGVARFMGNAREMKFEVQSSPFVDRNRLSRGLATILGALTNQIARNLRMTENTAA